jgi:hypothetical protein
MGSNLEVVVVVDDYEDGVTTLKYFKVFSFASYLSTTATTLYEILMKIRQIKKKRTIAKRNCHVARNIVLS